MGYWSDEREDLNETIRLINQGAIRRAQENAELKEEIEKLKMEIKNLNYILEEKISVHSDQLKLPFSEWGHGRAMPNPDGRWNWYGSE
tara:strand:+ start:271 stop:534 length:264 start_codon:yes stop_codon:yes gene_type:complete